LAIVVGLILTSTSAIPIAVSLAVLTRRHIHPALWTAFGIGQADQWSRMRSIEHTGRGRKGPFDCENTRNTPENEG